MLNSQNHARAMKIRPKTKKLNLTSYERILILDNEKTSLIGFWDVFHEIRLKMSFYNLWRKSLSHGVRKKVWSLVNKCFVFWKLCEKFKSSYLEKFFSLHKLRWDEKILKIQTKSSLLSKISSKLSLLVSPLALQN